MKRPLPIGIIKKRGIIIEFKRTDPSEDLLTAAQQALQQIHHKKYAQELRKKGVDVITAFGIAFKGKEVLLSQEEVSIADGGFNKLGNLF